MVDALHKPNNNRAWRNAMDKYKSILEKERENSETWRHFRPLERGEFPFLRRHLPTF